MRALRSWRVTIAFVAFFLSLDAWAQPSSPSSDGGVKSSSSTDVSAPKGSTPAQVDSATPPPDFTSLVAPEPAPAAPKASETVVVVEEVDSAPPPQPPRARYTNKWLKPVKLARHYGFAPNFHWDVLGYFFYGLNVGVLNNKTGGYATGVRAHLDFGHLALYGQYERFVVDSNGKGLRYDHGKVMVGVVPTSTPYGRFRILAGMDILSMAGAYAGTLYVSPVFGLSGRLGNGMFGLDVSSIFGLYPLYQLDFRMAFVVRIMFLQLHLGYQVSYRSAGPGSLPGLGAMVGNGEDYVKNGPLIHGPQAALGFGW